MPTYRLLAAACLCAGAAAAQVLTDSCVSTTSGVIPPASAGHMCDPRKPTNYQLEALDRLERLHTREAVVEPKATTASVSVHRLAHEVPAKARKAYLAAEKSKRQGELDKAIEHYRKAVAIDPYYLEAWNNLGSAHIHLGDFTSAQAELARAYAIDPTANPVLTNLAFVLLRNNRHAEAEPYARRAVQANPLAPRSLYVLGVSLAGQGKQTEEAIRLLEQSCDTVARAHFALAPLLAQSNRLADAAEHLKKYLALQSVSDRAIAQRWLTEVEAELRRL